MGTATGDVAGTKGSASTGGLYSAQSYDQWFSDVMGTNLATQHSIILTKQNDVWEYSTDAFYPLDGMLLGNESKPHNYYFTYTFNIPFMHRAGEHRFVEFQGDDDCWVFIDGKLAMDLGGIRPNTRQYLDVDRLGLSDGAEHRLDFFYAQRNESFANFRLRTSLDLGEGLQDPVAVTIAAD
jgi:fibro-slime domain-containing protein